VGSFSANSSQCHTASLIHDAINRLTHTIGEGTGQRGWTLNDYPSVTEQHLYTGITDSTPSTACTSCRHDKTELDGLGRIIKKTLVSDPEGATLGETQYDNVGRAWKVSNPYRSTQDPTYGWTKSTFDALDRSTDVKRQDNNHVLTYYGAAVTSAGGRSSQLCASGAYGIGFPVLSVDEAGRKRQTWIDGLARLIEVDEPDKDTGSLTSGSVAGTCYGYDALGNLKTVVQGSQTRTFNYDGLSRLTSASNPESGTINYYYTTSGGALCAGDSSAVCRKTDARSITTTFEYDALNRLTRKSYNDSNPQTPTVKYLYDGDTPVQGGDCTVTVSLTVTTGKPGLTGMCDGS